MADPWAAVPTRDPGRLRVDDILPVRADELAMLPESDWNPQVVGGREEIRDAVAGGTRP